MTDTTMTDAIAAMREASARITAQNARIATLTAENTDLSARVAFLEKMRELAWAEAAA